MPFSRENLNFDSIFLDFHTLIQSICTLKLIFMIVKIESQVSKLQSVGHEALDSIIMPLLEGLTPDEDYVLDGLCEVMKQNSKSMLPYLLPKLTKPPVNVHALCKLASVAGQLVLVELSYLKFSNRSQVLNMNSLEFSQ